WSRGSAGGRAILRCGLCRTAVSLSQSEKRKVRRSRPEVRRRAGKKICGPCRPDRGFLESRTTGSADDQSRRFSGSAAQRSSVTRPLAADQDRRQQVEPRWLRGEGRDHGRGLDALCRSACGQQFRKFERTACPFWPGWGDKG